MRPGHRMQGAEVERPGVERKRAARDPVVRLGTDREHVDDRREFRLLRDRAHEMPQQIALGLDVPERPAAHA